MDYPKAQFSLLGSVEALEREPASCKRKYNLQLWAMFWNQNELAVDRDGKRMA